jgi:magnesium transporter
MKTIELEMTLSFINAQPIAAARELEMLPVETALELFQELPIAQARKFIRYLLPSYAARLCLKLPKEFAANLIIDSSANQTAAILRSMPKKSRLAILKILPKRNAQLSKLLLTYSQDMVGAWMAVDLLMLPATATAEDAVKRISDAGFSVDNNCVHIVNDSQHLVGVVNIRDLLRADSSTVVSRLMQKKPVALQTRMSLATAVNHDGWKSSDSLGVLNHKRQLVGLLCHKDLRRSLSQFREVSKQVSSSSNSLINGIGEAYAGTLSALLGLVGEQVLNSNSKIQGKL